MQIPTLAVRCYLRKHEKNVCSLQIRQQEQNKEMIPAKEANDKSVRFRSKAASMAIEACKGSPRPQRGLGKDTQLKLQTQLTGNSRTSSPQQLLAAHINLRRGLVNL